MPNDTGSPEPEGVNPRTLEAKMDAVERARRSGATGSRAHTGDRLPPGQRLVNGFPVLDLGIQPAWDPETWVFTIDGAVDNPVQWSWAELQALPHTRSISDFHCVTHWSKYDVQWDGVLWKTVMDIVRPRPEARFLLMACRDRYTTNVPLSEMQGDDILLSDRLSGEPLPLEHGGPMRMIIPHLYAWKSAKFLQALRFSETDSPGFWEVRGYHAHGDPWREERYSRD